MKRVKLSIKTSSNNNYKYYVYRSSQATDIPASVNALKLLDPIVTIDEAIVTHEAVSIDEILSPDRTKIPVDGKIPYKLNYQPLLTPIHPITLQITYKRVVDNATVVISESYKLEFNDAKQVVKALYTNKDSVTEEVLATRFEVRSGAVFIDENILTDLVEINGEYYIEVINAYDDDKEVIDGIAFDGPVATGISKPVLDYLDGSVDAAVNTALPTLTFMPSLSSDGVLYYYRIVATDSLGNVSDPSGIFSIYLNQNPGQLKFKLQSTEQYFEANPEDTVWTDLVTDLVNGSSITLGDPNTSEFLNFGKIVVSKVPVFQTDDVSEDTSYILVDGSYALILPNIWQQNNATYNTRLAKTYRVIAYDTEGKASEYSELTPTMSKAVPIEKVVVLRKDVTDLTEAEKLVPLIEGELNVSLVKTWIREGGIFYDEVSMGTLPKNIETTAEALSVINEASAFDNITFVDKTLTRDKVYNYTMYLYDAYGVKSTPVVHIATV